MSDYDYLARFNAAYLECALWAESADVTVADDGTVSYLTEDDARGESWQSLNFDESYLSADALETARSDCFAFVADAWLYLRDLDPEQCGHDFWLTRNRHGAGFWDRGLGDIGERLTQAAHAWGEANLYWAEGRIEMVG